MTEFSQGDIIRIEGYPADFLVISKNSFIKATGIFHVCPMLKNLPAGPLHISATGRNGEEGTVVCEQIKAIDPQVRACRKLDGLPYGQMMNISDAIQGIFEYD